MHADTSKRAAATPLRKKLALLCGAVLFALLVAEVGLRCQRYYLLRAAMKDHTDDNGRRMVVGSEVPGLIYTYLPNVTTNSQGYIDFEYELRKPPGVFRIVVIGDSVAAGQRVALAESFPKLLERKLNRASGGRKFEVVVLARSGYSTCQEIILLKNEAFEYDHDLILWSYVLNDPAHPLYHGCNSDLVLMYRPKVYLIYLLNRIRFRLKEAAAARDGPEEFHGRIHHVYWEQVAGRIGQIGRLCHRNGVPGVFVIHPLFEKDGKFDLYGFSELHEKLAAAAAAGDSGLLPVDLRDAYEDYRADELSFPMDPWHPNELGHQVAAEFLYRRMVSEKLVPLEASSH